MLSATLPRNSTVSCNTYAIWLRNSKSGASKIVGYLNQQYAKYAALGSTHTVTGTNAYVWFLIPLWIELQHIERRSTD